MLRARPGTQPPAPPEIDFNKHCKYTEVGPEKFSLERSTILVVDLREKWARGEQLIVSVQADTLAYSDCTSPKRPFQAEWLSQHKGKRGQLQPHLPLCLCPGLCAASDPIPGILQRAGVPKQGSLCTIHLNASTQEHLLQSGWELKS